MTRLRIARDPAGQNIKLFGTNQDITERKRTEEALFESEARYRDVVENSLVGFVIIQDRLFRFANQRFCEMHGHTYEEIVDKMDPLELTHPEDRKMVTDRILDDRDTSPHEFRGIRKDGKTIALRVIRAAITFKGRPAISGAVLDVTDEKAMESRLRQAEKMEAIGQLAGGVAHDFNNILTVITGCGTLIRMALDKEQPIRAEHVDQILTSSERAAALTQSLLAFSRKQQIRLQRHDLNTIVAGTGKLLRRLLPEDIELRIAPCPERPAIMADITQIDQILINLTANARDAMPKGGLLTYHWT